jgi:adenine phosphoribosyltransferase
MKELKDYVTTIPNFPKEGIMFRDVTSVIQDKDGFKMAIDSMMDNVKDIDFDVVIGLESRGFIFGAPIAYNLGKPFVLVRKKGKLPCETIEESYDLEYGSATVEIHTDSIKEGDRVLIVDDLIATGGTCEAAIKLAERLGGKVVALDFLIELEGLNGRERLKGYEVRSSIKYEGK